MPNLRCCLSSRFLEISVTKPSNPSGFPSRKIHWINVHELFTSRFDAISIDVAEHHFGNWDRLTQNLGYTRSGIKRADNERNIILLNLGAGYNFPSRTAVAPAPWLSLTNDKYKYNTQIQAITYLFSTSLNLLSSKGAWAFL